MTLLNDFKTVVKKLKLRDVWTNRQDSAQRCWKANIWTERTDNEQVQNTRFGYQLKTTQKPQKPEIWIKIRQGHRLKQKQ